MNIGKTYRPKDYGRWDRVKGGTNIVFSLTAVFLGILTFLPIVFVIIISFTSEASIAEHGYSFRPASWSLDAYRYLIKNIDYIGRSFLLSAAVMVFGTLLSLWLISTMAFTLSRRDFPLRRFYTVLILIPLFFSGGLVASYVVNTQLFGLKDSFLALILPSACSTWYILVMRTYFRNNIPEELYDAARIDGAGTFRLFFRIVLPLSKPILVTVGLFEAFAYWNSWYYAMLYISPNHKELYPLQYVLYSIQNNIEFMATNDNISGAVIMELPSETFRMAVVVIIIAPILLSYPFLRRFLVRGMTTGAVKE